MIFNILNGDSAVSPFREYGIEAESVLVWREVYTEGPLDGSGSLELFRKKRAGFLASFVRPWTEEQILRGLERMDNFVLSAGSGDTIRIWADACMFDQMYVSRVLYLVSTLPRGMRPAVELFADDVICQSAEVFHRLSEKRLVLTSGDIEYGAACWLDFTRHSVSVPFRSCLRFMRPALERRAAELPDPSGLGLTERRIVSIVGEGVSPVGLFKRLSELEEYPWFGDTTLWHIVDSLACRGFLKVADACGVPVKLSDAEPDTLYSIVVCCA